MKITVVTAGGDGQAIAWRLKADGHAVDMYLKEKTKAGQGITPLRRTLNDLGSRDLVVCVGRDFCDIAGARPTVTLGPTKEATRLELDRAYGMRMMEAHGVETPEWKEFHSVAEGKAFAKKYGKALVLKPNGKKAICMLTMVAEEDDNDDLLSLMDLAAKRNPDLEKEGFLLQEKVEGIEMSAGSYFNGFGWAQPVMCTFENKKLAPKPWPGPTTGEMGSHAFWSYEPKLFTQVTKKMTPFLQEMKYRGDFDINCIITKHGPLALEMTPRTGFPAVCLQMSNFKGDFGEFLYNVAAGEPLTFEPVDRWGVGVLMTCPPFPYDEVLHDPAAFADIPVYGKFTRDIYPLDVDMEDGAYYSSGTGWIAVACGTGPDLTAAKNAAYKRLKTLRVPNAFARSDIGDRFFEEKAELEKGGWLS